MRRGACLMDTSEGKKNCFFLDLITPYSVIHRPFLMIFFLVGLRFEIRLTCTNIDPSAEV